MEQNYLVFQKSMLDKACKDTTHFSDLFRVEVFLHKVEESSEHFNARFKSLVSTSPTSERPPHGGSAAGRDAPAGTGAGAGAAVHTATGDSFRR